MALFLATRAEAQPFLSISSTEVAPGAPVTVTITAYTRTTWALAGSTRATGLVYAGVPLGLGTDVAIIASGGLNGSGQASFLYLPPPAAASTSTI